MFLIAQEQRELSEEIKRRLSEEKSGGPPVTKEEVVDWTARKMMLEET